MGTITVKIKKNPHLYDIISDSGTLYYEYDIANTESITVSVAAKTAMDVIESGKAYAVKYSSGADNSDEHEQRELSVEAPENSRFHVCFVDGSENDVDVLVSKSVFIEHLSFQLEDERSRWKYREYENTYIEDLLIDLKRIISDIPLDEIIERRDNLNMLERALKSLTPLQYKHLIKHFIQGKTFRQIGDEENTSHVNIVISIQAALKKLKVIIRAQ